MMGSLLRSRGVSGLLRNISCHSGKAYSLCSETCIRGLATKERSLALQTQHIELQMCAWPKPLQLNHIWLRDHCRCNECYNYSTSQRKLDLLSVPRDISPNECKIEGNNLLISWPDGHRSTYSADWLWENSYERYVARLQQRQPVFWNADNVSERISRVPSAQYLTTECGLKQLVQSIVDFGIGMVENVPATLSGTEEVVRRLADVQHTLFGGMWEFSNEMAHSDTAYTRDALGAHTDNTYFTEGAGLQVFHCFLHEGSGGENLLVDGFSAAHRLKAERPDLYEILARTPLEAEYLEPGQHYAATGPVLRLDPVTGSLQQVRFNLYDRAALSSVPPEQTALLYEALRTFAELLRSPEAEWWLRLKPGCVIFLDNWRVLHGRAAYTGHRTMAGCYVSRSDFTSKARVLGLM